MNFGASPLAHGRHDADLDQSASHSDSHHSGYAVSSPDTAYAFEDPSLHIPYSSPTFPEVYTRSLIEYEEKFYAHFPGARPGRQVQWSPHFDTLSTGPESPVSPISPSLGHPYEDYAPRLDSAPSPQVLAAYTPELSHALAQMGHALTPVPGCSSESPSVDPQHTIGSHALEQDDQLDSSPVVLTRKSPRNRAKLEPASPTIDNHPAPLDHDCHPPGTPLHSGDAQYSASSTYPGFKDYDSQSHPSGSLGTDLLTMSVAEPGMSTRKSPLNRSPKASSPVPPPRALAGRHQQGKKPSLACHFCRQRKIACGAPLPGSTTCNQCERRQLECRFPTESRRGMRKANTGPPARRADSSSGS